jgi:hypothetical protein
MIRGECICCDKWDVLVEGLCAKCSMAEKIVEIIVADPRVEEEIHRVNMEYAREKEAEEVFVQINYGGQLELFA